jgi:hypothetical protein
MMPTRFIAAPFCHLPSFSFFNGIVRIFEVIVREGGRSSKQWRLGRARRAVLRATVMTGSSAFAEDDK